MLDIMIEWLSILNFDLDDQVVVLTLVLLSTIAFIMTTAFIFVGSKSPLQKKIEQIRKSDNSDKLKKNRGLSSTLESLAPVMAPKDNKNTESIRHQLMHAGFHDSNAITVFYAAKGLSLVLGLGTAALLFFFQSDMANLNLALIGSVAAGVYSPNVVLNRLVKKRQSKVRAGVPDALDLLVVCTESGLGFNAALRRVADELVISHPDFADELDTVCAKIKAGIEMSDAFDELIERTGISEITGLVNMLAHASKIGGSLAQTLREYTEDYRDKRNQEVEEIAAKIPTKMIFPLLLFIWPCFFIVAIGPSMLSLTSTLGN